MTADAVQQVAGRSGWWPVAASAEITQVPRDVEAGGVRYVAFRPGPGEPAAVLAYRCPHRLVRLSHGERAGDRLRCAYHGWEFEADGRCALVPSAGPDADVPPRAHLDRPWGVREEAGQVWVAPVDPAGPPGPPTPDLRASTETFTNLDPSLRWAWHPVARSNDLPITVRLLASDWALHRAPHGGIVVSPTPAGGVQERYGLVWIAPETPRAALMDVADDAAPDYVGGWLAPEVTTSPAGVLAENFLDVAHFPFVHVGTFGAAEEPYVPAYDVEQQPGGFRSVQEQWFDNPEDPGVRTGLRPVRQRRRATYVYRAPFQLLLRLEELDAAAVKTILFFLQPQDLGSTRIWTKLLLHGVGGVPVPGPDVVARELAFEKAVLAEDLTLQRAMTVTGLPLRMRDELHVRSDRSGVALRRALIAYREG
jgi:phenylpropionate dioxygenase-like ring-hydroxylating dioxygenase large terminal subunit